MAGPPPPPLSCDPRGSKNRQKSAVFDPLRCIAQGGWGGSAHYSDPTAQSVASCAGRRPLRHTRPDDPGPARRPDAAKGAAMAEGASDLAVSKECNLSIALSRCVDYVRSRPRYAPPSHSLRVGGGSSALLAPTSAMACDGLLTRQSSDAVTEHRTPGLPHRCPVTHPLVLATGATMAPPGPPRGPPRSPTPVRAPRTPFCRPPQTPPGGGSPGPPGGAEICRISEGI